MNNNIINSAQQSKTNAYYLIDECRVLMTMSEDVSVEYIVSDVKSMIWTDCIDPQTKVLIIVPNSEYAEFVEHQLWGYGIKTEVIEKQHYMDVMTNYNDLELLRIYELSYLIEAINEFSNKKSKKRKAKLKEIIYEIFDVEKIHIKKYKMASACEEVFYFNEQTDSGRSAYEFYKEILSIIKHNISPRDSKKLLKKHLHKKYKLSPYPAQIIENFINILDFETWEDVDVANILMHMLSPQVSIASFEAIEGRSECEQTIDRIYVLPFGGDGSTQVKHQKIYRDIGDLIDSGAFVTYIL
jgi:hypothetical protein